MRHQCHARTGHNQSTITLLIVLLSMIGLAGGCTGSTATRNAANNSTDRPVTVRTEPLTLAWWTSEPIHKVNPRKNSAIWPQPDTKAPAGERTFETVVLENEFLRVAVIPEIGGPVSRAVYKPTGEDLFFLEGRAKNWLPFWESGVKASFPWREHSIRMEDQPASWRIVCHEDGAVTLAMWMEFSRHDNAWESAMFGAYSTMMLSQHVTLRPGRSDFAITYRVTNPTGYRQGRRIWTDALFPRYHTPEGIVQHVESLPPTESKTQGILPATYLADHRALNIRPYHADDLTLAKAEKEHNAVFGIGVRYGFAGLYYPTVQVNRLRLSDPEQSPGAKFYWRGPAHRQDKGLTQHMDNFVELWGGSDHIMEGVEHWLPPGETYEFTHRYTMVHRIGKVDYANHEAAVDLDLQSDTPTVAVVPYAEIDELAVQWNGKSLGKSIAAGPETPARFDLPADIGDGNGTLTITANQRVILEQRFPLNFTEPQAGDEPLKQRILAANDLGSPSGTERLGDQMDFGRTLDKAARQYPAGSVERGRVQLRLGRTDQAIATLRDATGQGEQDGAPKAERGEAWHLLGLALLESGQVDEAHAAFDQAIKAEPIYDPARYYLALSYIAADKATEAATALDQLIAARPNHWEAKLLRTWLAGQTEPDMALAIAKSLSANDPADPRVVWLQQIMAERAGDAAAQQAAAEALAALTREPGADRRLTEFRAATRGEYLPPIRMKSF